MSCVTSLIPRGRNCHDPHLTPEKTKTQATSLGTTEPANGRHGIRIQLCAAPEDRLQATACVLSRFSRVQLCDPMDCSPPGSSVHGFSRQKYWSGLPFPSPGDLPYPGIEPVSLMSPALAGRFFTTSTTWEDLIIKPTRKALGHSWL